MKFYIATDAGICLGCLGCLGVIQAHDADEAKRLMEGEMILHGLSPTHMEVEEVQLKRLTPGVIHFDNGDY